MNFAESLHYLLGLGHETLAIKFGLENTERLLEATGQPQRAFPKVQIAGTNGKGSVAVMLDAAAREACLKTGLYTSPHLVSITERIRTSGREITTEDFARLASGVRERAMSLVANGALAALPTFFEHVTVIALAAFKEAEVELAILETGLGGRLDSTTAAGAEVVAITPVAFDHQEYLGRTIAEIAAEKAAIIRPGVAAIVAPQMPEAMEVILRRCAECEVKPRVAEFEMRVTNVDERGRLRVSCKTARGSYENVRLNLPGRHQAVNAAVAIALAETLDERGLNIQREAIIAGLESASHPGRLEWRDGLPAFLFDGAHNAAGARALREYLDEFVRKPVTLVFGAMRDKDLTEIAQTLFPAAQRLVLTEIDNPRSATLATLTRLASHHDDASRITFTRTVNEALLAATKLTPPDGIVCVTGSLYLVGEAQAALRQTPDEVYAS
jgi:dihydrofolate synthase/folylpolyglutamate synthase